MAKPKRKQQDSPGSPTNASDAVDDIEVPPSPTTDEVVDEAVKETFPASDPVSPSQPANTAHERKQRGEPDPVPTPLPKRSPDWMFEKKQ